MSHYTQNDLNKTYAEFCGQAIAFCRMTRELVGGQPATKDGVRAYVAHHLGIPDGPEQDAAVQRIMREEIGERETTPETGEVKERECYGLNVIRKDDFGPWLGDWQLKAAIKQSASRAGLFAKKRGTKGDIAEMGRVSAHDFSLHGPDYMIHLVDSDGNPCETVYQRFMGRVNTPQGAKSIVNDAECILPGARFAFRFQWFNGKLTESDIVSIFAGLPIVGVGSVKSLERGKFEIESLDIDVNKPHIVA
jgi:hypothetical protein